MSIQAERDRLLQKQWREEFIPNLGQKAWISAYMNSFRDALNCQHLYLGFIPNGNVDAALESHQWDIHSFEFKPYCEVEVDNITSKSEIRYSRYGFQQYGIEPFVLERSFHGLKPLTTELSEEYRLFHNLYFEKSTSAYLRFDEAGNESPVVKFSQKHVEARRQEIRQFMSAKNMSLVIYFQQMYASIHTLDELGTAEHQLGERSSLFNYWFLVEECDGLVTDHYRTRSWLLGKAIVTVTADHNHITTRFKNVQRQVQFKIGIDENDQPIKCSPDGISHKASKEVIDSSGKTVVATYRTPVFFKRSVLDRYRKEHSKYEIGDGYMSCGDLWGLRMDNNHKDFVIVFLGRLRDDLPVSEQSHWEYHNVPPDGHISGTNFRRSILAEFVDPEEGALRFQQAYESFSTAWLQQFGWHLFKPLSEADTHHFSRLRRPVTNELTEFHEIMLSLSILLQDRINKKELGKRIPGFQRKDKDNNTKQNIPVLAEYLESEEFAESVKYVEYLRMLQMLRSNSGTVHPRNEKEYQKAVSFFSLESKSTVQVADDIFTTLTDFLDSLRAQFCLDESD